MPTQLSRGARRRLPARFRFVGRNRLSTPIALEPLEPRYLCATDLQLLSFSANGGDLLVDYHVAIEDAAPFDIAIYRSTDGSTLGSLLQSQRVTADSSRASGVNHQISIAPSFSDDSSDYFVVVVLDAGAELAEANENNNNQQLGSGIFSTTDGTVHVHGSNSADALTLSGGSTISATLNASTYSWSTSTISRFHVHLHAGDDALLVGTSLSVPIIAWGGTGNDTLIGGSGNDVLRGGQGNDVIDGGDGDDWLYGDDAQVWGDATSSGGDDSIWGNSGNDWLFGEGGIDVVYGDAGNDFAYGGYGNDHVHSGNSNSSGGEYVFGEQGDDHLYLESASARYYDYQGNDAIHSYGGSSLSWSLTGSFLSVTGTANGDTISFGTEYYQGNYWLTLNGARIALASSVSSVSAYGGDGDDTVDMSALAASAYSGSLTTNISGGAGNDILRGSFAPDSIDGGSGNDWLYGYGGNDTLHGQEGTDRLEGGEGEDYLYGGEGDDTLYGDSLGGYGYGGYGYGGYGGYGTSTGGSGTDYLYGGNGNDVLDGGTENDVLDGGLGFDSFVNSSADLVTDRPEIINFVVAYIGNSVWEVTGLIVDDGLSTGRNVVISGVLSAITLVTENSTFVATVNAPASTTGWVMCSFADDEGLDSLEVAICIESS